MDWTDWGEPRAERSREIDFTLVRDIVAAWKWRLIAAPLAALLLIGVFLLAATPRYQAEAQVLLAPNANPPPGADGANGFAAIQAQARLVASRDLARRAIKELGIEGRPEFDPLNAGLGPAARTLILLGFLRDPASMSTEERILKAYEERLSVTTQDRARLVTIAFQSVDRDLAARAANRIADLYLEMRANAAPGSGDPDARVVARARAPSLPVFPDHALLIIFAASAGICTVLATFASSACLRLLPARSARAPAEDAVEQPRALGQGPGFARREEAAQPPRPQKHAFAQGAETDPKDVLADIVDRIASARRASRGARIVFTSLASAEAAPQIMLRLGRLLGREGRSIVIPLEHIPLGLNQSYEQEYAQTTESEAISCRVNDPIRAEGALAEAAPAAEGPGLGDLLAGRASFAEVIRRDPGSRLHFVAAGLEESLDFREFSSVLEALARTYDFILMAAPPVDVNDLAKTLAAEADFIVLSAPPRASATFAARAELIAAGAQAVLVIGAPAGPRLNAGQDAA